MRINVQNVKPGDRVKGIGLVVQYSEPHSDFLWSLVGYVSTLEEGGYEKYTTQIVLPNAHYVNVRRSDENFREDRLGWIDEATQRVVDDGDTDAYVTAVTRVANAVRGHHPVTEQQVRAVLDDAIENPELIDYNELLIGIDNIGEEPEYATSES